MNNHETPFPARAFASCFALAAFAISVIAGIGAQRQAANILITAIIAMFICQIVGSIAAMIIEAAVREHLRNFRAANPIPDLDLKPGPSKKSLHPEQTE